jgi:hypothetical protein
MVTGCAVGPARFDTLPWEICGHCGAYQGPPYKPGIDYETKMDEAELAYRRPRSAQERAQERERAREPRWEP